ncbi:hypothetical protein Scep_004327 [Stephania cephalantha]|uniref:Uncharacterized protein n=1 Tax=Stephania cephalantha TaxID=152367 RepID=A0AAP0KS95_9MAGN
MKGLTTSRTKQAIYALHSQSQVRIKEKDSDAHFSYKKMSKGGPKPISHTQRMGGGLKLIFHS